jgi:hypothetical protein
MSDVSNVRPNMRLKRTVRALYIVAHPLRRASRAARSLSATRCRSATAERQRVARIKDPLADLHFATVNQRIERTTAPPSKLDSASAAHPRDVGLTNEEKIDARNG